MKAVPKQQADKACFREIDVILSAKTYMTVATQVVSPNGRDRMVHQLSDTKVNQRPSDRDQLLAPDLSGLQVTDEVIPPRVRPSAHSGRGQTAVTKYNELQLGVGRSGRGGVGQASVGEPEHNTMTMTELPYAEPKPKLRWYQYGLRTALVFVSLVSVGMSWLAVRMQSARAQREAVVAVQAAGGTVRYQHELDASGNVIPVDGLVWDAPVDEWGNPVPGESSPGADAPAPRG